MLVGQNSRHSDFRLYLNMSYRLFCLLSHWIVNSAVPIQLGTDPAELLKKPCLRVIVRDKRVFTLPLDRLYAKSV